MDFPLETENGRLGYRKKGKWYDVSNFTLEPKGRIQEFQPGILWKCTFPDSNRTQDVYVPFSDMDRLGKFKSHMNGQYNDYVFLKCSDAVWARAMNSYMKNFNAEEHEIKMCENIGFQRSAYKRGDIHSVKYILSRNIHLNGFGELDPNSPIFMFPWRDDNSNGISYSRRPKFVDIPYLDRGRDVMAECFNHLTPGNPWQSVLTMGSALSCIYGPLIRMTWRSQFPAIILHSEEKGTGKTSALRSDF